MRNVGTVGAHGPIKPSEFFTSPHAQASPNIPLDDASDGWLQSVQQTAVYAASYLALCGSMLAAAQQTYLPDELPPQPAVTIVDEVSWADTTPLYQVPWNVQPQQTAPDELPIITVDDVSWLSPTPPASPGWNIQPAIPDADYIPQISVDDMPWANPVAPVVAGWNAQPPASLDPDYPPQISVDEIDWQNPVLPSPPGWSLQPQNFDLDYVPPPAATIVDEIAWFDATLLPPPSWNVQFTPLDQDYAPQISIDEIAWFAPAQSAALGWDRNAQPPIGPDADYIPQIAVSDDVWNSGVAPVTAGPNLASPIIEPDQLLQIAVSDDVWINFVFPVAPPPNLASPIIEQDQLPQIAVSEDNWQAQQPWTPSPFSQQLTQDTDAIVPQASGVVDEMYWQQPQPWAVPAPPPQPVHDTDSLHGTAAPSLLDEVFWFDPLPPSPWPTQNFAASQVIDDSWVPSTTFVVWFSEDLS